MTTPLEWKAFEITNAIYKTLLRYPTVVSIIPELRSVTIERNARNLIPLYMCIGLFALQMLCIVDLLVESIILETIVIEFYIKVLYMFSLFLVGTILCLAYVYFTNVDIFYNKFYNRLLRYEIKILRPTATILPFKWNGILRNGELFKYEYVFTPICQISFKILRQYLSCFKIALLDIRSAFVFALAMFVALIGICFPPVMAILGLDPINMFVKIHQPKLLARFDFLYVTVHLLKYIVFHGGVLEMTRVVIVVCVPTILLLKIYDCCTLSISKLGLCSKTLALYNQLHCINQIALDVIRVIAGTFMAGGFAILVFGSYGTLSKARLKFPTLLYVGVVIMILLAYAFLLQTLPVAARCYMTSKRLLFKWKRRLLTPSGYAGYWRRVLRSQRPIALYYGLTKFDNDTLINFLQTIWDATVTLLLMK